MKFPDTVKRTINYFEYVDKVILFKGQGDFETELGLYKPPLNGKKFNYYEMSTLLKDTSFDYVLSRKEIKKYAENSQYGIMSRQVVNKFKDWNKNDGELGELLLYSFLEGVLKAPQILSKMSIKTNKQMYVYGADGVHLYKEKSGEWHFVYGESKVYKDFVGAFREAITSISRFLGNEEIQFKGLENYLISSNIYKEELSEEELKIVEEIIYPGSSSKSIPHSDAFGIFIGFEIELDDSKKKLTNEKYNEYVNHECIKLINRSKKRLENIIEKNELKGNKFYVYLMPFTDIDNTRKEIIKGIVE